MEPSEVSMNPLWWWVAIGLVGLYFITRVPWWTAKFCVPSPEFVEWVQAHAPGWALRGAAWIKNFPEEVDAQSFFATLLWPVVFGLNLVLLAQALEIFMPSASRMDIPYFGSYTWLSLLAGLLYSISQTVFGVFAGESRRKTIVVLFVFLVLVTIAVEMGLAGYRSYLIISGVVDVDSTTADSLLSKGVVLTMFISFVVPVSHSALGFVAVPRFLVPIVNYLPRFIGGVLLCFWSWFMRFYFGFQRVSIVPAAVGNLRKKMVSLQTRIQKTEEGRRKQQANRDDLDQMQMPFSEVQKEIEKIATEPDAIQDEWKAKSGEFSRLLTMKPVDALVPVPPLQTSLDEQVNHYGTSVRDRAVRRIQEVKRLMVQLEEWPKRNQKWAEKKNELTRTLPLLKTNIANQRKDTEEIRVARQVCHQVLHPPAEGADTPKFAMDVFLMELADLRNRGMQPGLGQAEGDRIRRVLTICEERLEQTRSDLDEAVGKIEALDMAVGRLDESLPAIAEGPKMPPENEIAAAKQKLASAPKDLMRATERVVTEVKRVSVEIRLFIRKQAPTGEKIDPVAKTKKPPNRFFAWLKKIVNDLLDGIMGANEPKKKETKEAPEKTAASEKPVATVAPARQPAALAAAAAESGPVMENGENSSVKLSVGGQEEC